MQVNSVPLIKFLGTMTVPATGTESVGLPADALLPRFLLVSFLNSIWTGIILNIYNKCHHYTYSLTRHFSSVYRDKQKPRQPATRTATQLYHRAVCCNWLSIWTIYFPACHKNVCGCTWKTLWLTFWIFLPWQILYRLTAANKAYNVASLIAIPWQVSSTLTVTGAV